MRPGASRAQSIARRVRFYCARHSNHTLLGLQNAIPTRSALSATAESISLDLVQKWFRKGREVPGAAQRSLPVIMQTQIWKQTLRLPSSLHDFSLQHVY